MCFRLWSWEQASCRLSTSSTVQWLQPVFIYLLDRSVTLKNVKTHELTSTGRWIDWLMDSCLTKFSLVGQSLAFRRKALPNPSALLPHQSGSSVRMCSSYGTVAVSVDKLILVTWNQSDSTVGGTLKRRFLLWTLEYAWRIRYRHYHKVPLHMCYTNQEIFCDRLIRRERWKGRVCLMSSPTDSDLCVLTYSSSG